MKTYVCLIDKLVHQYNTNINVNVQIVMYRYVIGTMACGSANITLLYVSYFSSKRQSAICNVNRQRKRQGQNSIENHSSVTTKEGSFLLNGTMASDIHGSDSPIRPLLNASYFRNKRKFAFATSMSNANAKGINLLTIILM